MASQLRVDWRQVVRQLNGFAIFGALAWIFGPQVPAWLRVLLVVLAVASAVASSCDANTITARLIKTPTVPTQRTHP
jgi:hypothetical protein